MPNTLYDYYTSQGQQLPSLQDRAKIFETQGLGKAADYIGSAAQNTALLTRLSGAGAPPSPVQNAAGAPAGGDATTIQSQIDAKQKELKTAQDLLAKKDMATQAGEAGLSVSEFEKLFSSGTGVTPEEAADIRTKLGITDLEAKLFTPPAKTTEQLYNDAYSNAGLAEVKTKMKALEDKIAEREQQLNERLAKIDENPWLSEASRAKSVQREKDFFERTISTLSNQVKAYQEIYNAGVSEVDKLVQRQTTDFSNTFTINKAKLEYLLKKAENEVTNLEKKKGSEVTKLLPEYLQAKTKATKPDVIGSAESGYYQWDAKKGQFVQITKSTGGKPTEADTLRNDITDMSAQLEQVKGQDGFISPQDYAKARRAWTAIGGRTAKSFDEAFAAYRNPDDTYQTYKEE